MTTKKRRGRRSVFDVPNPQTCAVCATIFSRNSPDSKRTLCGDECRATQRSLEASRREAEDLPRWAWLTLEPADSEFPEVTWPEEADEDAAFTAEWGDQP